MATQGQTRAIPAIEMATPSDLAQIWEWNESVPASFERRVHEMIQERIDAQPTAPAIAAWDGELTYGELDRLATGLAGQLVELGVGPQTASIIPLCFEKSMWTAVAMLGVLKAGAGFVLIDPNQPEQRLRNIVRQTEANIIVSSCSNTALSSRLAPQVVILSLHSLQLSIIRQVYLYHFLTRHLPFISPSHQEAPVYQKAQ